MTTKITASVIEPGAISTASLADTSITAAKLAGTLDLTGKTVTVATATAGDNDTTVASTAFVTTAIANLTDSAPAALDTLNELAAALNDDADFSTTVTNSIATKLPLAGGTLTGDLNFGDSDKAVFGTGSDLQIYHDGSNSIISNSTGRLDLRGANISIKNLANTEFMLQATENGAVSLYHDNAVKLATTSTGIDVTGDLTSSGRIKTTDGLFQADEVNQRFRQYAVGSLSGNQTYLLRKIQTNDSINGGVTGVVKAAYDPGDSITNVISTLRLLRGMVLRKVSGGTNTQMMTLVLMLSRLN